MIGGLALTVGMIWAAIKIFKPEEEEKEPRLAAVWIPLLALFPYIRPLRPRCPSIACSDPTHRVRRERSSESERERERDKEGRNACRMRSLLL